ncbi:hypothetical protein EYF80_032169 [Liparis tanakae]|uniref:Uncharacterized protein n=1 Tax=Liparis tanakae TaxID=230148 RepID=A0A4Z2GVA9_9TELE|nr:hypothetical protein EYF80_032169 [Liparis tanakae]
MPRLCGGIGDRSTDKDPSIKDLKGGQETQHRARYDDGVDGNALGALPLGVNDGTLSRRGTEAGIGPGQPALPGCQAFPCQSVSVTPAAGGARPSHHTPPSLVSPTLVNTVFLTMVAMAYGLVLSEVPGATPKKPFSGLMALSLPAGRHTNTHTHTHTHTRDAGVKQSPRTWIRRARDGTASSCSPWPSNFIHAMSSPTHSTFQPGRAGFIMAKLVLPQALGKAAAT